MTATPRPRVVVSGYYGFRNAGDEAILATFVQEMGPWADLVVLSANPLTEPAATIEKIVVEETIKDGTTVWRRGQTGRGS